MLPRVQCSHRSRSPSFSFDVVSLFLIKSSIHSSFNTILAIEVDSAIVKSRV